MEEAPTFNAPLIHKLLSMVEVPAPVMVKFEPVAFKKDIFCSVACPNTVIRPVVVALPLVIKPAKVGVEVVVTD